MADPMEFTVQESTLQKICSLMFWSHRVASAATDVAIAESVNSNPVHELVEALERTRKVTTDWLDEIRRGA
jgi:hypothetical protein